MCSHLLQKGSEVTVPSEGDTPEFQSEEFAPLLCTGRGRRKGVYGKRIEGLFGDGLEVVWGFLGDCLEIILRMSQVFVLS